MRYVRKRSYSRGRALASYKRRRVTYRRKGRRGLISTPKRIKRPVRVSPVLRSAISKVISGKNETKQSLARENAIANVGNAQRTLTLGVMAQGVGESQRVGEEVTTLGIRVNATFYNTVGLTTYVRMFIIKSKTINTPTPTAASPIYLNELQDGQGFTGTSATPDKLIALPLNTRDYTPIWNKVIKLSPTVTEAGDTRMITQWIPLAGKIIYEDNTGGQGAQNHIYYLIWNFYQPLATSLAAATITTAVSATLYYKDS